MVIGRNVPESNRAQGRPALAGCAGRHADLDLSGRENLKQTRQHPLQVTGGPHGGTHDTGPVTLTDSPDRHRLIRSAAGSTGGGRRIMNKVTKTTSRGRSSQNGMPEPVPYVYRQQNRRDDWTARIARPTLAGVRSSALCKPWTALLRAQISRFCSAQRWGPRDTSGRA